MEPCELTPKQVNQWEDTMTMMMWTAPGFRHILYRLLNQGNNKHTVIPSKDGCSIACTDGKNIVVNPDEFFKFSLPERVYITAHEIIHNVFGDVELLHRCNRSGNVPMHDGTNIPFSNAEMQKAMDARINALIEESEIGKRPSVGHFDPKVTSASSVLDIYKQYFLEAHPDGKLPGGSGDGSNPGGFDSLLPPGSSMGQNPNSAGAQRNQQQWQQEIMTAQTLEQVRSHGKMAAGLKRLFKEILQPEVPWVDHIQTIINRATGDGGYDWTKPNPWFAALDIYQPSETGHGAGWIVMWGDTSGSRSDAEVASNMAELAGIMEEVNPQRLTVIWCDAEINYVDEITDPIDLDKIRARGTGGGGGTDLDPVMGWIRNNGEGEPDLFIGFTDGYVGFPEHEPKFPVIWASSTDVKYPWGQVVRVNKKKRGTP